MSVKLLLKNGMIFSLFAIFIGMRYSISNLLTRGREKTSPKPESDFYKGGF